MLVLKQDFPEYQVNNKYNTLYHRYEFVDEKSVKDLQVLNFDDIR